MTFPTPFNPAIVIHWGYEQLRHSEGASVDLDDALRIATERGLEPPTQEQYTQLESKWEQEFQGQTKEVL